MTKKDQRVTPSVVGDTNLSDATDERENELPQIFFKLGPDCTI